MSILDTKLKSDIAESATVTKLLKLNFKVLKPFGDRLPYDLGIDLNGRLIKLQVKSAWLSKQGFYTVDIRRTKTNRRIMKHELYKRDDFDFAIIYIEELDISYVVPIEIFLSFKSGIALVEKTGRQRKPRSSIYREAWHLIK